MTDVPKVWVWTQPDITLGRLEALRSMALDEAYTAGPLGTLVWLYLLDASRHDGDPQPWPMSMRDIANKLGVKWRQVEAVIPKLAERRMLSVASKTYSDPFPPTVYRVEPPAMWVPSPIALAKAENRDRHARS